MRFSLIMTTRDRTEGIGAFLDSLLRQPEAADCELLVVDQNPDDRLADIVSHYAGRILIRHVRTETRGLSRGRNVGLGEATGELIGFPDDDCEYPDGLLAAVDRAFRENPDYDAVTGLPTPVRAPIADQVPPGQLQNRVNILNRCQEFTIFIRRTSLDGLRFNPMMGVGAGTPWGSDEGPDLLLRLMGAGKRVVWHPQFRVYHPNKVAIVNRATLDRASSYACGRGALLRAHRIPLRIAANSLFRPTAGSLVYLLRLQPMRSAYYLMVVAGLCRGLRATRAQLAELSAASARAAEPANPDGSPGFPSPEPIPLPPLPARPLVSVLVTCHNYARFLPRTLDALLAQTYDHFEVVICDDGSTDNSADIARAYADRDPRFRLFQKANGGQNSALTAAIPLLGGDVVCLLDADDLFTPDKLARVVAAFIADPIAGACYHPARVVDDQGRKVVDRLNPRLEEGWLAATAVARGGCAWVPTTSCMSFRTPVLATMTPAIGAQQNDADGYMGMAAQFLTKVRVIDEPLGDYRIHGKNMGGLTDPTPGRLRYELRLIAQRTNNLRRFLSARFGQAYADRVRIADNPQFVQAALKLHAVDPANPELGAHDRGDLIAHHPDPRWRALWRLVFLVPLAARRRMLEMIHHRHQLRFAFHRTVMRPARPAPQPTVRPAPVQPRPEALAR